MLKQIWRNNLRRPVYSLAVILFAAALAVVLCYLYQSAEEEKRSFEETYASVPVIFCVTKLDGSKPISVPNWIAELFTEEGMKPTLAPYVGELYIRTRKVGLVKRTTTEDNGLPLVISEKTYMSGISSLYVAEELTENYGGEVHWYDSYDASILTTEEPVCLVPESLKAEKDIQMTFYFKGQVEGQPFERTITRSFRVVGYCIVEGNSDLCFQYVWQGNLPLPPQFLW